MSKRKTHEEFITEISSKNPNVEIIGKYVSALTKINCRCKICGHKWSATPNNLLKGKGCLLCKGNKISKKLKKSHENFICELKELTPNIDIIGKYQLSHTKIHCKCRICGHEWNAIPSSLLSGHGCPECGKIKCANSRRKSCEKFVEEMQVVNPSIEIVGEYIKDSEKIQCKCLLCGSMWKSKPTHLLQGHGCPNCVKSNGEDKIEEFLRNNNITYITQKRFDNLIGIGGRKLSYDFYIPDCNILIEFNGEQHWRPIEYFGGEQQFKTQKEHDKRKKTYAKDNNIELLEIWYYDFDNIEDILKSHLLNRVA